MSDPINSPINNQISSLINKRRSIRKYNSGVPVTREQLNRLMEAAMLAPSACNSRPWEFIAITKREVLDKIAEIHPFASSFKTATAAIIVVADPPSGRPEGYFPQCCGAATQNILLEAASMGLGSCWCGLYPREERMEDFRKIFNIPQSKIPFCVIAIGSPDESPERRGFFDAAKVSYVD